MTATPPRLTPQTIAVLRFLLRTPAVPQYGLDIARATGLKTGTLHPILARLQRAGWVDSFWEAPEEHEATGRPRRRYYRFTAGGVEAARLAAAEATMTITTSQVRLRTQPGY